MTILFLDTEFTGLGQRWPRLILNPWPHNLPKQAMIFDSYTMGVNRQPWLSGVMAEYHTATHPEHHALHDAQALRAGIRAALDAGWMPKW